MGYKFLENFADVKRRAEKNLAPFAALIAKKLNVDKICIVGGAVRDFILAALIGHIPEPKDYDVILSKQPKLTDNENIAKFRLNYFGGTKITLTDSKVIDIFQQIADSPTDIIEQYFDFNCNSIYFCDGKIHESEAFMIFLQTMELSLGHPIVYRPEFFVPRALKFQIQFKTDFGLDVKLSDGLIKELRNLDNEQIAGMHKYTKNKYPDLYLKIMNLFVRLRD